MKCDTYITRPISKCRYIFSDGKEKQNKTDTANLHMTAASELNIYSVMHIRGFPYVFLEVSLMERHLNIFIANIIPKFLLSEKQSSVGILLVNHRSQKQWTVNCQLNCSSWCQTLHVQQQQDWSGSHWRVRREEQPCNTQIQPDPCLWSTDSRAVIAPWVSHR